MDRSFIIGKLRESGDLQISLAVMLENDNQRIIDLEREVAALTDANNRLAAQIKPPTPNANG